MHHFFYSTSHHITSHHITSHHINRFMKRCREATTEDPKAKHYVDILMSSVEYITFVKLMKIMRYDEENKGTATET